MELVLNGKRIQVEGESNLHDLLVSRGLEPDRVVVEYNYSIVKREEWKEITLKDNDNLEVLRFVGGG